MRKTAIRCLLAAAIPLATSACGYHQKHGYGWVARAQTPDPTPLKLPEEAPSISQRFRPVAPPSANEHRGFDILVPQRTPVLAAADGKVARVSRSFLYGRQILLNHAQTAPGYRLQTRYFHLAEQSIERGETVKRGQLIGYSGATGIAAGPFAHLHFEVHRLDQADPAVARSFVDPQLFWVDGEGMVTCFDRQREYVPTPLHLTYPVPCRGISWR